MPTCYHFAKSLSFKPSWLLLAGLLPAFSSWGAETAPQQPTFPALYFSGFATFAGTYNDNDAAGVVTSFAQKRPANKGFSTKLDSVLGGQIDWWLTPTTSVTLQGVARVGNEMEPELRLGYLRQQLGDALSVRLGRIRTPVYFDSDVTEIGYAYLLARPALPIYGLLNSFSWLDGGDVQWRHPFGNTVMLVQGYGGRVDYAVYAPGTTPKTITNGEFTDVVGLAVSAILPRVTFRLSYTEVGDMHLNSPELNVLNAGLTQLAGGVRLLAHNPLLPLPNALGLQQQAAQIEDLINPYDGAAIYTSLGFDAYLGAWRLMGEWVMVDPKSAMLARHDGFQLTAGRSFGQWTPYVSYAQFERKTANLNTQALTATGLHPLLDAGLAQAQAELDRLAHASDASTESLSVGVRWDFRHNMALKVQYDHFRTPDASTRGILAVETVPFRNEVNVLTVGLDVVF
ncbi:hypothetical protein SAMN05421644_10394 [Allochromatium warmingii]|uniref:Porin n=1 Tax=Allochromatium warmingii TaxID=61595 RepID=A0A1H3BNV2_ALLWA|nr:hypothetical protein [Allochromatium warmingii]SDX43361.1 hypothetical protein SAMN05421644_10394 [Allochromatium warmingii]